MRARVVFPTRSGPSMAMKRGGCGLRWGTSARLAAEESLPGIVGSAPTERGDARIITELRLPGAASSRVSPRIVRGSPHPQLSCPGSADRGKHGGIKPPLHFPRASFSRRKIDRVAGRPLRYGGERLFARYCVT